jgi:hypothetical protein
MLRANWVEHRLNTAVHMLSELKPLNLTILGKIQRKKGLETLV